VFVGSISEIRKGKQENNWNLYNVKLQGNKIVVEGSVNSEPEVSILVPSESSDKYFLVSIGNDEGDGAFYDSEKEDLNYDIYPSYFIGDQKEILDLLMEDNDLITDCKFKFGAARNG
jgi:hypothetical protein